MSIEKRLAIGPAVALVAAGLWWMAVGLMPAAAHGDPPSMQGPSRMKKPKPEANDAKKKAKNKMPALAFTMKDIDDQEQDLRQYYGNLILMVNTASQCGYTPQYKGLEAIYRKYHDKGFVVLGFPANNFGQQEPGSNEEIKKFCTDRFDVSFPMFAKVSVKGEDICDLYKYLTGKKSGHRYGGDIPWNFNKFLIDRRGKVIGRFEHKVPPDSEEVTSAIDRALKRRIPDDSPLKLNTGKEKPARG